jgi:hypothetical protein
MLDRFGASRCEVKRKKSQQHVLAFALSGLSVGYAWPLSSACLA